MKLKLASFLFLGLLATGCSHQPTESDQKQQQKQVIPEWVTKTPVIEGSFNAVASASYVDSTEAAKQIAFEEANQKLYEELLADLKDKYTEKLLKETQNFGKYENAVRQKVRDGLPRVSLSETLLKETFVNKQTKEVYVWAQLPHSMLTDNLQKQLVVYDNHLRNYIHVSSQGSNLSQALSILPALPTLEARKRIKGYLEIVKRQQVKMPGDDLAFLLDRQLTNKFDEMVVSLNAQTRDTEKYESLILKSMKDRGFNMSARKPDLMIKYFVEPDFSDEGEMKKLIMVTDAEMIGEKGDTFASISKEYQGLSRFEQDATQQAIDAFCDDITEVLVNASVQYMDKANQNQPLPMTN